jgi:hypothetical protein
MHGDGMGKQRKNEKLGMTYDNGVWIRIGIRNRIWSVRTVLG